MIDGYISEYFCNEHQNLKYHMFGMERLLFSWPKVHKTIYSQLLLKHIQCHRCKNLPREPVFCPTPNCSIIFCKQCFGYEPLYDKLCPGCFIPFSNPPEPPNCPEKKEQLSQYLMVLCRLYILVKCKNGCG